MNKRFYYELLIGCITLITVYIFGVWGFLSFSLMIAFPFLFRKEKLDERELLLLHQTATLTLSLLLMVLIVLYYVSSKNFGSINIGDNWLQFAVLSFLITHGAAGIFIFRIDKED